MNNELNDLLVDRNNLNFFLNEAIQINTTTFLLSLICSAILCFFSQLTYIKFASTLSSRSQFAKNFVVLGITTCIIIMIVKNSIALSLGLVGALSIVRFRAAIKEPEELVYLFLVIAVGLGCGAGQLKITVIGTLFSLILIFLYYKFYNKLNIQKSEVTNLSIIINDNLSGTNINDITKSILDFSSQLEFISLSQTDNETILNFDVKSDSFENITKITDKLKAKYKNSKIIFAKSTDLSI